MNMRKENAIRLFQEGYNCSQAVFLSYSDLYSIAAEVSLKIASGFGGGIAGLGEICGAINGAVMILGLKYGFTELEQKEEKQEVKKIIRDFITEFRANHKGINCRNLLTEDEGTTHKVHSKKCENLVAEICDLLEKYLNVRE